MSNNQQQKWPRIIAMPFPALAEPFPAVAEPFLSLADPFLSLVEAFPARADACRAVVNPLLYVAVPAPRMERPV